MHFLDLPYYSQYQNVLEPKWKSRACGITCAKMVIKYFRPDNDESIDALIDEGVRIGGYGNHGWDHESLVRIFRNRGIHSYREEFKSQLIKAGSNTPIASVYDKKMMESGIKKMKKMLEAKRPVIVSVEPDFSKTKSSHLIVLTGFDLDESGEVEGFMYNDPYAETGIQKNIFVDIDKFKKYWRRLAVFVG
jgi:uncharacterized protein YvpB